MHTQHVLTEFRDLHRLAEAKLFPARRRKELGDAKCAPEASAGFLADIFSSSEEVPGELSDHRGPFNVPTLRRQSLAKQSRC